MKIQTLGIGIATCLAIMATATQATAGTLRNGWNYSIDAVGDGSPSSAATSIYDIKGIAIREYGDNIVVAINANTPLAGVADSSALGGSIGWGDLFFNFTGGNFRSASNSSSLFGVRFAAANNSGVNQLGVYTGVSSTGTYNVTRTIGTGRNQRQVVDVKNYAVANRGYQSLKQYYDYGWGRANTQGDLATTQAVMDYYSPNNPTAAISTVITAGNKIGTIESLSGTQLGLMGLDFNYFFPGKNTRTKVDFAGTQTFGFQFSSSLLPRGNFIANIFLECGNDGVALKGARPVPEPSAMAGLMMVGLALGGKRFLKRRTDVVTG